MPRFLAWLCVALTVLSAVPGGHAEHIAILGESGGDAQACSEVKPFSENFVVSAFPAPDWLKVVTKAVYWATSGKSMEKEYHYLPNCNTHFRDLSIKQAAAIASAVQELQPHEDITSFCGWKFIHGDGCPPNLTLLDTLARMQEAGVTKAFMFDQDGLATDNATTELSFNQVRQYLHDHPEWPLEFIGINGHTEQPGFPELLAAAIDKQVQDTFPGVDPSQICVVLPSQGVPASMEKKGDQGIPRYRNLFKKAANLLPQYNMTITFQDWGGEGFPFPLNMVKWSEPSDEVVVPSLADAPCPNIFVSPLLQWPTTDISVLYRQEVLYPQMINNPAKTYKHTLAWDLDPNFISYTAKLISDVIDGKVAGYDLTFIP